MFNIGQYFEKFLAIKNRELYFRTLVQRLVKEKVGLDIKIEDVSIKGGVVSLKNLSSGARSVLFIKKQSLLEALNGEQKTYVVKDVR